MSDMIENKIQVVTEVDNGLAGLLEGSDGILSIRRRLLAHADKVTQDTLRLTLGAVIDTPAFFKYPASVGKHHAYVGGLAAQDGLENLMWRIPWDDVDVLFIGGSTEWKTGDGLSPAQTRQWASLWCEAHDRAIPIHMGRVNTNERLAGVAQQVGAATVDGTLLAFGPDKNLKVLEHMLDYLNVRNMDLGEQRYPELGRFPNDRELHEVALDPDVHSVHDLGAYMPAASAVDAIRRNFRMPALKGYRRRHPKKNADTLTGES